MIKRKYYFNQLLAFKDKQIIKVITGIMHCGKSILMKQFANYIRTSETSANIIYLKLDEIENEEFLEYHKLYNHRKAQLNNNSKNYIFIDEVQLCENFQKPVETFFNNPQCDIYLTGSNADILSGELATCF